MPHFYIMDKSHHLAHYGHKGQKWGVRNYQNYDGTYTQAGLERYWPNSKHGTRGSATKERGGLFTKADRQLRSDIKRWKQEVPKSVNAVDLRTTAKNAIASAPDKEDWMMIGKGLGTDENIKKLAAFNQDMYTKLRQSSDALKKSAEDHRNGNMTDDEWNAAFNAHNEIVKEYWNRAKAISDAILPSNAKENATGIVEHFDDDDGKWTRPVTMSDIVSDAMYHANKAAASETRGGHERGFGPLSLFAAGVGAQAGLVAGALAYDAYSRNSVVKNCADWPAQKTEVELSSYFGNHNIANNRNMAAQIVRKMPTDVDGVQLSKDIASGKDLKDLPSIKSLANDIQFEFNSAMDSAVYGNDKYNPAYGMANAMKPKYIKGLDHKYDKQVSEAIYVANAEAYKQYNPSVEGQELPKIRGGKERGGEIRTFETTKFGDVKQKSSYITGTDINNGIVKATRANNEDTATAQDNAIKALKNNKSIQDVAQLVGKAYHEYVVEQADYNHVSNKKTIPLLYPSKTKQSDMQASHEKLGKAQAAMSAEIRSMMRIALEKDYNKKTPYTNKGKPITYGELANKAVMQILKESNSKANRKDLLNVTLAARDYNRKQARRGSTVDEAKLERQRSEISKLRGKVYDEWGNIIDQKAYKQLQRAKANYKKTKQG